MSRPAPRRILSIVEAATVTGPVKPLLMFSRLARRGVAGRAALDHSLLTTVRPGLDKPANNGLLRAAAETGLEVETVPESFPLDPRVLGGMARIIRARAPDIVETHDFKSHFLLSLLLRSGSVGRPRWLAFHHGYTRMSARVRVYQQLDRLSLRAASGVVTLCEPFVEQLTGRGVRRDRVSVISNAVEPRERPAQSELDALRARLGIAHDEWVIASVGRLSAEKGHDELIAAFRALLADGPRARMRLLLVGDGGERELLRARAADLGDRVLFAGHQADAWPWFCIADLFALPSHTEGSPLVLFEAMQAGLPIVATRVGSVPEVVNDGVDARLIAPRDVAALTAALAQLRADPAAARRLGQAARRRIDDFSPDAYASRLMSIYDKVLAN
jgi:glycosyltransferase involved in cell wall biosynthesis